MKMSTIGITAAIACISLYVFAEYRPLFSALQRKIISEITAVSDLLSEGTELVLTGEQAQKRITEKRQEHDLAAKKALERQKNLSSKGKIGGYGGSGSYGKNRYGGGGGYNPYAGVGRPYAGGHGGGGGYNPYGGGGGAYRSPYTNMGYDDDYNDDGNHHGTTTPTSMTKPASTADESKSGGGVDLKAQEEAKKLEQERAQSDNELIAIAQRIAATAGGQTEKNYDANIQALIDDEAFSELASAASTHHTNTKRAAAAATTATSKDVKAALPAKPAVAKTSPLDSKIASLYRQILPHLIYAATRDAGTSTDAARALKTDVKKVLGQDVVDQEVKKRADKLIAEWKKETEYENEMKVLRLVIAGTATDPFVPPTQATPISKGIAATTRAPGAAAVTNDEVKTIYKQHFERYLKDLADREKRFKGFGSATALAAFDKEIKGCNQIIDPHP